MSVEERIENLEQEGNILEQDTIIPDFQNPDRCIFCVNEADDTIFYELLRICYNYRNGKDYQKQDKETCIHHKNKWLRYSYGTGGFIWAAITDYGKKSMTNGEIIDLFKNKEQREKLLTEFYDKTKKFCCAIHLYLRVPPENKKNRYNNAFTIEDDIPIQDKIIQNKFKTEYTSAIEVLQAFDEEI